LAGAGIGLAIGGWAGPIGAAIGAAAGLIIGGIVGAVAAEANDDATKEEERVIQELANIYAREGEKAIATDEALESTLLKITGDYSLISSLINSSEKTRELVKSIDSTNKKIEA
jgi:nicotinamide mononucleotide (NMN) deamidase PncC